MARRITGGIVGEPSVGGIQIESVAVITSAENRDITIAPSGTGRVLFTADAQLQAQNDLRFADADSSNFVAIQAPETIASDYTLTLPTADGSVNQVLSTNGSGILNWVTAAVSLTDNTSENTTHYLTLTTATTDTTITALRRSSSKLFFNPSTGRLTCTELKVDGIVDSYRQEETKTTSYTLALADAGKVIRMNIASGSATITVPPNSSVAFPIGTIVWIYKSGAGIATLAAGAGVTLTKTGTFGLNEEIYIRKRDTNIWVVTEYPFSTTATGGTLTTPAGFRVHTYTSGSGTFVVA